MIGENSKERSRLKGLLFEMIIMKMLSSNGFDRVSERNSKIREKRLNFVEVRGRGTWHQIDCLCDYNEIIPFIYPIRLFGELKYYSDSVKKDEVREFIGVLKDIQENYFVSDRYKGLLNRVTEIGVFFAANGFQAEAEKLAFVHNIKTISYKNNFLLDEIKKAIDELERNHLSVNSCISKGNYNDFIRGFEEILDGASINRFRIRFHVSNGAEFIIEDLLERFERIRSSFIGSTRTGVFLHFISDSNFPDELFYGTDIQECEIYYYTDYSGYFLVFSNDNEKRRFYFSPPNGLRTAAFSGGAKVLNQKERIFGEMHVSRKIEGINRNLTIRLNNTWLKNSRRELFKN